MLGMERWAYIGVGVGWGAFGGEEVCDSWLSDRPEFHKPVGEAIGQATVTNATVNTTRWQRSFRSGTRVEMEITSVTHPGVAHPGVDIEMAGPKVQSCIYWSDGSTTGNAC